MSRRSVVVLWCLAIAFVAWSTAVQNQMLAQLNAIESHVSTMEHVTSKTASEAMYIREHTEAVESKCDQIQSRMVTMAAKDDSGEALRSSDRSEH